MSIIFICSELEHPLFSLVAEFNALSHGNVLNFVTGSNFLEIQNFYKKILTSRRKLLRKERPDDLLAVHFLKFDSNQSI